MRGFQGRRCGCSGGPAVIDRRYSASSLFHEFRLPALRPRVIMEREGDALAQRRGAVGPELDEWTWGWGGEVHFVEDLKGTGRDPLRGRDDGAYDLHALGLRPLVP